EQTTHVAGKAPVSLGGAWFLYAQAEFPGGKSRALAPELLTVSRKSDHDVALHLLDVHLPQSIDGPYKAPNRKPHAWQPSPRDPALGRGGPRHAAPHAAPRPVQALPPGNGRRGPGRARREAGAASPRASRLKMARRRTPAPPLRSRRVPGYPPHAMAVRGAVIR